MDNLTLEEKIEITIKKLDALGITSPEPILNFLMDKEYNPLDIIQMLLSRYRDKLERVLEITGSAIWYPSEKFAYNYPEYSVLVTSMDYAFAYGQYEEIDLSKYDTRHINSTNYMFKNCRNLKRINLQANTKKIESIIGMFENCESIEYISFDKFDISNVMNMSKLFKGCIKLKHIDSDILDFKRVRKTEEMFWKCDSLEDFDRMKLSEKLGISPYY